MRRGLGSAYRTDLGHSATEPAALGPRNACTRNHASHTPSRSSVDHGGYERWGCGRRASKWAETNEYNKSKSATVLRGYIPGDNTGCGSGRRKYKKIISHTVLRGHNPGRNTGRRGGLHEYSKNISCSGAMPAHR